ncbi:MAG: UvrD-helicase domain-containing protein [Bacteroidota bacterium]
MPATIPETSDLKITVISAGAGSGKTYTLTGKMTELLKSGIRAGGIVATTFTQKAAAELQERVRVRLLEAGMSEAANELGSALIGTVHSIGTRMLQRFAFEAGVSPLVEIIAESDGQRLFNESLSQVLTEQRIETMNRLADRLGLSKKGYGEPYDWRRVIRDLTDVARANNFSRKVLETSKIRSWESFEKMLPPAQKTDAVTWDNRLLQHLDQTAEALDANESDSTKLTRDAAETLRGMQNQLKWRGELYWHEWVKIAKTNVGAKSRDLFQPLKDFVLSHDEHTRYREDIQGFIYLVFDIAMDALGEYEQYKQKRGLIDYTDMETYVSRLLRMPEVEETLRGEIDLLLVDEFQDTSPIQLDIFLQLSRIAKHSIWVGDPKQSIYGFRGAEPKLMQAIIDATGGIRNENILKQSWRSRQDIVHAVNAIFTKAFPELPEAQIALEPVFSTEKERALDSSQGAYLPGDRHEHAIVHWHFKSELDERKIPGSPWTENCIAQQIKVLIERETPVFNKKRDQKRPVRPGDIAVLCRNNKGCQDIAEALHRAGLKAAISRGGLLETPEAKLVLACMQYLLTASDGLSATEIVLLTGGQNLEQIVENRLEWLHALQVNREAQQAAQLDDETGEIVAEVRPYYGIAAGSWMRDDPYIEKLNELRPYTADLSASEILNVVLDELDLRRVAVGLGNPAQRLDNIDRLRHYALEYESASNRLHSAASLGGFLLWLRRLADNGLDAQGSGENPDAVKVLTYHRSKGLEYPVTICHNLDQPLKEQIWGINLVSELETPDLQNILGNRWIRFWVNPYADQFKGTRLEETLMQSDAWIKASAGARAEEARLLYVGLTRARDYLIFPTTARPTKWLNRVFNHGDESIPTLDPNADETPFYYKGEVIYCNLETVYAPKDFPEALPDLTPIDFHPARKGRYPIPRQSLWIDAQQELTPGFQARLGEPIAFGNWLEFKGEYVPEIGKCAQSALMGTRSGMSTPEQLEMARRQIMIRQIQDVLPPELLVRQMEHFQRFVQQQFMPSAVWSKYPLEIKEGQRQLKLEADLFLENPEFVAVILFADFAEGMKKWNKLAQQLSIPLAWHHRALRKIFPGRAVQTWVVFPVEGQAVAVE